MIGWEQVYSAVRAEIVSNHVLMHWFTIIVIVILLAGAWALENRSSVLGVLLPIFALSWAAAMVRFDFFIHRQGTYLRVLERELASNGVMFPLWETWKGSRVSTNFVVPVLDVFASLVVFAAAAYIAFGPARSYLIMRRLPGAVLFPWAVVILLLLLLGLLAAVPALASW